VSAHMQLSFTVPSMNPEMFQLTGDLIALHSEGDSAQQPTLLPAGKIVILCAFIDDGEMAQVRAGRSTYLVAARSLKARSMRCNAARSGYGL
jgi:hypothetical protein